MIELLKLLWSFVPFIREMIWPGKTNKEILLGNKFAVFLCCVLLLSASLNWLLLSRVYAIAMQRKAAEQQLAAVQPGAAATKPLSVASQAAENSKKEQDDLRERLNAIFEK